MPHRSLVSKTRVLCKKKFIYSGVFKSYSDVFKPYSGVFLQFMEIESLKLYFHVDFFPHCTHPLTNRDLKTRVLNTRDASFQHCFETWQLTKFFLYLLLFGKDDLFVGVTADSIIWQLVKLTSVLNHVHVTWPAKVTVVALRMEICHVVLS